MIGFVQGSVSPDAPMYTLWAFVFLCGVKALQGSRRWLIPLLLGSVTAVAVKYQSVALLPGVGFVGAVYAYRKLPWPRRAGGRLGLVLGTVVLALAVAFLAGRTGALGAQLKDALHGTGGLPLTTSLREYLSYIFQFYFGHPSFLTKFAYLPPDIDFWHTIWIQYWGAFSLHEVQYAPWVYYVILVIFIVLLIGAVRAIAADAVWRRNAAILAFLGIPALALFLGLHWTDYKMLKQGHPFIQARYFLPLNPLIGLMAGAGIGARVNRRTWAPELIAGAVVALVLLLNLISFGAMFDRFYA
jgi:hypothetical protein